MTQAIPRRKSHLSKAKQMAAIVKSPNKPTLADLKLINFRFMNYTPQPLQLDVHRSTAPILVISGGEGGSKSYTTSAEIASRYPLWQRVLFVCYKAESAKNEGDYLFKMLSNFGGVRSYDTPRHGSIELVAQNNGVIESISTFSEGERAVSGTGKNYDIIAMLEAGKQRYSVFLACLLRISRSGGLLILSGTIERSEPWFPDVITRLQGPNELNAEVFFLPTWENRTMYPGGRNDPKILQIEKELGPDLFLERCAGKPAPLHALVLKEFSFMTHVFDWVKYDPAQTVEAWIDYGYSGSHYSVLFVQFHPRAYTRQFKPDLPDVPLLDVWVIGDLYLDHATHEETIIECKKLPWWKHVTTGVGDVIGKSHPQAGQSPFDVWQTKANLVLRGQYILIPDNIDRQKTFLKDPATGRPREFFSPNCKGLIEFSKWRRKEIGEGLYGDPESKNCDFIKANGYGLIDNFGRVENPLAPRAVAFGERSIFEDMNQRLPQIPSFPNQQSLAVPPNGGIIYKHPQYLVIPRRQRKIG